MKLEKDNYLYGWHLHHTFIEVPGIKWYFNWYLKSFHLGLKCDISSFGIDITISFWASIHGYFVWSKKERKKIEDIEINLREFDNE